MSTNNFPCARHCSRCFRRTNSCNPHVKPTRVCIYSHSKRGPRHKEVRSLTRDHIPRKVVPPGLTPDGRPPTRMPVMSTLCGQTEESRSPEETGGLWAEDSERRCWEMTRLSPLPRAYCPPTLEHLGEVHGLPQRLPQQPVGDFAGDRQQDILEGQSHPHLAGDEVVASVVRHQVLSGGRMLVSALRPGDIEVPGAEGAGGTVERHRASRGCPPKTGPSER